jgi:4-amino-4-deoxy-L-arabinose transferase-like glycosyltransferase
MYSQFVPTGSPQGGRERQWLLAAFALLGLAWCLLLFGRSYWTPDEPREAALAASVAQRPAALPTLAGQLFAEKPPLTYWLAGASQRLLGATPAATRLPQLAAALLSLLAVMSLARSLAGARAAWVAGLLCASTELFLQVGVWLDTDAWLLAGVCVALAGMQAGIAARTGGARLRGYLVMHAGLTLAFFGKNFAAWMVPVLAFIAYVAWEKRWRELLGREFWIGALLPIACIGTWVARVAAMPGGDAALRVLFYNNLVGRALAGQAAGQFDYASGHANWPGKYLVELPLYLLPWTPLALYGLWRALRNARVPAWRFALCAALPGLALLSFAATARGIYAAPCMPGFALLAVLAWREAAPPADARAAPAARGLRVALALCALCIALLALVLLALTLGLARSVLAPVALATGVSVLGCLAALVIAARPALPRLLLAWCLLLSAGAWAPVAAFDRTQDLAALAARILARAGGHPLLLWQPDETTQAMAALYFPAGGWQVVDAAHPMPPPDAKVQARLLVAAPGGSWKGARWREYLRSGALDQGPPPRAGPVVAGYGAGALVERPGGRGYLLWQPSEEPPK